MDKRKTRLMRIFNDIDNSTEANLYQDDDGHFGLDKYFDPQENTSVMLPMAKNLNAKIAKGKRLNTSILFEPIDAEDKGVVFPKLTDVLPTLVKKTSFDYDNVPGATVKNISIDINKIDIDKFKRKIKSISENIAKDEPKVNTSRRQAVIATNPDGPYRKASRYMLKRKTLDLMLQTLYMGRHKVKSLEGSKYFNNKDTGFRIAFTYRRLLRIYRKMIRIFSYGYNNRTSYDQPNAEIILHGKVTRLHVDFVYLFWVVIKLDGNHKEMMKVRDAHQAELNNHILAQNKLKHHPSTPHPGSLSGPKG